MTRFLLSSGAAGMALSVAAGAFGAHALRDTIPSPELQLWETACRYLTVAAIGVLIAALAAAAWPARGWSVAGLALLAGGLVFSATVGAMALGGPRWLGAVTPIGGTLIIAGFALMAVTGARALPRFDSSREPV